MVNTEFNLRVRVYKVQTFGTTQRFVIVAILFAILKKPNAHAAELPFAIYHAATVSGTFFGGDFKSRSISAPKCLLPIGRTSPCKGMKPLQGKKVLGTRVNEILCSADGMCDYQPSLDDEVVGRPSRMERSMKAPRLHLSALRIRYFCVPGGALEELPFQTGGRSGPATPTKAGGLHLPDDLFRGIPHQCSWHPVLRPSEPSATQLGCRMLERICHRLTFPPI